MGLSEWKKICNKKSSIYPVSSMSIIVYSFCKLLNRYVFLVKNCVHQCCKMRKTEGKNHKKYKKIIKERNQIRGKYSSNKRKYYTGMSIRIMLFWNMISLGLSSNNSEEKDNIKYRTIMKVNYFFLLQMLSWLQLCYSLFSRASGRYFSLQIIPLPRADAIASYGVRSAVIMESSTHHDLIATRDKIRSITVERDYKKSTVSRCFFIVYFVWLAFLDLLEYYTWMIPYFFREILSSLHEYPSRS